MARAIEHSNMHYVASATSQQTFRRRPIDIARTMMRASNENDRATVRSNILYSTECPIKSRAMRSNCSNIRRATIDASIIDRNIADQSSDQY